MSEESTQLVKTTCVYQVTDRKTGDARVCGDKAVSPGYPYCYKHVAIVGAPNKRHKRYEDNLPELVKQQYEHQLEDDKPGDLIPELANLRALINIRFDNIRNTVTPEGTIQVTDKDLVFVMEAFERVRKLAETQARINPKEFVPIEDVKRIIKDMVDIIRRSIPNEQIKLREQIVANVQRYCMDELAAKSVTPNTKSARQDESL